MKKSLLIFGLFFTMTILTSFTEPTDVGGHGVKNVGNLKTLNTLEVGGHGVKNVGNL